MGERCNEARYIIMLHEKYVKICIHKLRNKTLEQAYTHCSVLNHKQFKFGNYSTLCNCHAYVLNGALDSITCLSIWNDIIITWATFQLKEFIKCSVASFDRGIDWRES